MSISEWSVADVTFKAFYKNCALQEAAYLIEEIRGKKSLPDLEIMVLES